MFKTHFSFNSVSMNYYDVFWHSGKGELFLMWNNWEEKNPTCCLQDFCHQPPTAKLELGIIPLISQNSLQKWICAFALHFWMYCQCSPGGDSGPPLLRYSCPQKIEDPARLSQQQSAAHTALKGWWLCKQGRKKLGMKLRTKPRFFGLLFSCAKGEKKLQRTEQHLLRMLTTDRIPG